MTTIFRPNAPADRRIIILLRHLDSISPRRAEIAEIIAAMKADLAVHVAAIEAQTRLLRRSLRDSSRDTLFGGVVSESTRHELALLGRAMRMLRGVTSQI